MKTEKILAVVLVLLIILSVVVYLTLPEQGEQIYIPQVDSLPENVVIPEGYKPVDNFTDVYYVETEDGIRYYWLVAFSDGTYGWQEIDKDGNIIFPNREPESTEPTETEGSTETTEPSKVTAEGEATMDPAQ